MQDFEGNLIPEHEWPSENYGKSEFPHIFPDSSPESAHEQEQVSHHSPIFVKVYLLMYYLLTFSVCVNSSIFLAVRDHQIRSGAFICKSPLRRISELVILSYFLNTVKTRVEESSGLITCW